MEKMSVCVGGGGGVLRAHAHGAHAPNPPTHPHTQPRTAPTHTPSTHARSRRTSEEGDVEDEGVQPQRHRHGHQQPGVAPHRHAEQAVVLGQSVGGVTAWEGVWGGVGGGGVHVCVGRGCACECARGRRGRERASPCASPPHLCPPPTHTHTRALTASRWPPAQTATAWRPWPCPPQSTRRGGQSRRRPPPPRCRAWRGSRGARRGRPPSRAAGRG